MSTIATLEAAHAPALRAFFDGLPDQDVTSVKEDVRDPRGVDVAVADTRRHALGRPGRRRGGGVRVPATRVSASPVPRRGTASGGGKRHRRQGLGRALARKVLLAALQRRTVAR